MLGRLISHSQTHYIDCDRKRSHLAQIRTYD